MSKSDVAKLQAPHEDRTAGLLQTTTEKLEEKLIERIAVEELSQKVEKISEPPVVEAAKPTEDVRDDISKLLSGRVMQQSLQAKYSQCMLNYYQAQQQFYKDMMQYQSQYPKPKPQVSQTEVVTLMKKIDKIERERAKIAAVPILPNRFRSISKPATMKNEEAESIPAVSHLKPLTDENVYQPEDLYSEPITTRERDQDVMDVENAATNEQSTDIPSRLQQTIHTAGTQAVTKTNELSREPESIPEVFHQEASATNVKYGTQTKEVDIERDQISPEIEIDFPEEFRPQKVKQTTESTIHDDINKETPSEMSEIPTPSFKFEENVPLSVLLKKARVKNQLESFKTFMDSINTEHVVKMSKCPPEKPPACPPKPPKCPPKAPKCPPAPCPKPAKADCTPKKPRCPPAAKVDPCKKKKPCPDPCGPPKCPPKKKGPCSKCCSTGKPWFDPQRPIYSLVSRYSEQSIFTTVCNGSFKETPFYGDFEVETDPKKGMLHAPRGIIRWARDFEPWTPIPCWPVPKNEKKKKLLCPQDGCKGIPPPKDGDFCHPKQKPFQNEESPILSRSFSKTEWTKPKFDLTKPYKDIAEKCDEKKYAKNDEKPARFKNDVKKANRNCSARKMAPESVKNKSCILMESLNLQELLAPPMAAVCYVVARHNSNDAKNEVFWRPLPTDPKMQEQLSKISKYLQMSYFINKQLFVDRQTQNVPMRENDTNKPTVE
ncbi:titin-like [Pectinophora gossypiella]|uniref:titin-like n=1 Tax=Pectinophora gossypiella TaxID=13191 RepID=UPI00214EDDFA|nr:titin-like [Pectinophora gossypiella]